MGKTFLVQILDVGLIVGVSLSLSDRLVSFAGREERTCLSNVRQIPRAMPRYAPNGDQNLPTVNRDDRGNSCDPGNPGLVAHFVESGQWNQVVRKYLKSTYPSDPTTPRKVAPSLGDSAANGPGSLWLPTGCELRNGVVGAIEDEDWIDRKNEACQFSYGTVGFNGPHRQKGSADCRSSATASLDEVLIQGRFLKRPRELIEPFYLLVPPHG